METVPGAPTTVSSRHAGSAVLLASRRMLPRAMAIAAVVVWCVPWRPDLPLVGLDHGWRLALAIACERGFVFGVDLVFPFGPYGCLATWQYWPSTYVPGLLFWGAVSLLTAALALPRRETVAALLALLALLWLGLTVDTLLMALPVAYVLHAYRERVTTLTSWTALGAMGPLALVKFTILPVCLAAAALGALARGSPRPWRVIGEVGLVVAAMLVAWVATGQPLHALDDYLRQSIELTRGYAEAMGWPTLVSRGEAGPAAVPVLLAVVAAALFLLCLLPQRRAGGPWVRRLAWPAFVLVLLALAVKHATTRADAEHLLVGFVFCGAFGLLVATTLSAWRPAAIAVAVLCLAAVVYLAGDVHSNFVGGSIGGRLASTVLGVSSLVVGEAPDDSVDAGLAEVRRRLASTSRLRTLIDGTFDIVGHDQILLLGLSPSLWSPRPVMQSYAAYTPRLAALNADHVASTRGPAWLIVPVHTIDGRWPLQDDARLWPVLARHYAVVERVGAYLVLRRGGESARPAAEAVTLDLRLDDWTDLPAPVAGSWYARLELPAACSGGLRAAVWRPRACHLEVVVGFNPQARRFRLVPAIARDGFLLSPAVLDVAGLESWLRGGGGDRTAVRRLRVVDDDGAVVPVTLRLSSLPPAFDRPR